MVISSNSLPSVYVDAAVVPHLAPKLAGKSVDELCEKELIFEELLIG